MLRNASIRTRVLAILALPVLVLLVLSCVQVQRSASAAGRAGQLARASATQRQAFSLVAALDAERRLSQQVLSGQRDQRSALTAARRVVDPRLASEGAALAEVDPGQLPAGARAAVDDALSAGRRVHALRDDVDRSVPSPATSVQRYDAIIDDQVLLPERLARYVAGTDNQDALVAASQVEQVVQALVDERDQGEDALADGVVSPDERLGLVEAQTREDALRGLARENGASSGTRVPEASAALASARSAALGGAAGGPSTTRPAQWADVLDSEVGRLAGAQSSLRSAATAGADGDARDARRTAWLTALGALAAIVVPGAVALLLVRGLTAPLLALTEAAGEVRRRLPRLVERAQGGGGEVVELPAIPVRSRDEVGRLAAAFNDVNATSVSVASEQAALREAIGTTFTTLARRDQALLARQLTFIDALERAEDDPKTLSDLFVLDHLATRMRRNAESLLVLAGIEGGRRLRQPMAVSDLVRTAVGEVEDYQRVELDLRVDPSVLAHLALSAAHLLAELVENALTASPPTTKVVVGARWRDQPGGALLLWVADEGMGMSAEQRDRATSRLADTSATAAVGSSELGLFVVARLARRLGAQVALRDRVPRGTRVEVVLPAEALARSTPAAAPAPATTDAPAVVDLRDSAEPPADPSAQPAALSSAERPSTGQHAAAVGSPARRAVVAGAAADAQRRSGVFADFRPRRTAGPETGALPLRSGARGGAPADGADGAGELDGADAADGRPVVSAPAAPPGAQPAAPAARQQDTGQSAGQSDVEDAAAYVPARPAGQTAPPPLPGRRAGAGPRAGASRAPAAGASLPPFAPQPGESQPLTRRERKVVETGRLTAVAARAVVDVEGAAPSYRPATVTTSGAHLHRRERTGRDPVEALAPVIVPAAAQAKDPAWPTPPYGQRVVPVGAGAPDRRDPAEVRRRLSGYHSAVARARRTSAERAGVGASTGGGQQTQQEER